MRGGPKLLATTVNATEAFLKVNFVGLFVGCSTNEEPNQYKVCDLSCAELIHGRKQASTKCDTACVCKKGFFKRGKQCVSFNECVTCRNKAKGTGIRPGNYEIDFKKCVFKRCLNGHLIESDIPLQHLPPCSSYHQQLIANGHGVVSYSRRDMKDLYEKMSFSCRKSHIRPVAAMWVL